jgi:hypothetical protein
MPDELVFYTNPMSRGRIVRGVAPQNVENERQALLALSR